MRSVPDSHLINDYQPLDHRLISFTISTYSATWSESVSQLISTRQPLNQHAMRETWVQSLGWEDPLEKGKATDSSILAWRIPRTEELGRLQIGRAHV